MIDREWTRLKLLLPKRRTGRPPKDHWRIINALLWLAKTGAPWRDLPERFGPWRTVATRFYRWTRSGLWERILAELRRMADAKSGIDWEVHMIDGTSVRAHRCAAGAKGGSIARVRWHGVPVDEGRSSGLIDWPIERIRTKENHELPHLDGGLPLAGR
jgi:transposase